MQRHEPAKHDAVPIDQPQLDRLLSEIGHVVPAGFTERVMEQVRVNRQNEALIDDPLADQESPQRLTWMQSVLVLAGGLIGVSQLGRFLLGMWMASAAW